LNLLRAKEYAFLQISAFFIAKIKSVKLNLIQITRKKRKHEN